VLGFDSCDGQEFSSVISTLGLTYGFCGHCPQWQSVKLVAISFTVAFKVSVLLLYQYKVKAAYNGTARNPNSFRCCHVSFHKYTWIFVLCLLSHNSGRRGLDNPGFEFRQGEETFYSPNTSRPPVWAHSSFYSMDTGVLFWRPNGWVMNLITRLHLFQTLRISAAMRLRTLYTFFLGWTGQR